MTLADTTTGFTRDVTDDEVKTLRENGWVKLEKFLDPEIAAQILAIGEAHLDEAAAQSVKAAEAYGVSPDKIWWHIVSNLGKHEGVEPMRSVEFSKRLAGAAHKFQSLGRDDIGVQLSGEFIHVKMPATGPQSNSATQYHQDWSAIPSDRHTWGTFWVALVPVTPEMGSVRFLTGSHREGGLSRQFDDPIEKYPHLLEEYEWSPPLTLEVGDATYHHCYTVHGAPENATDTPRWAVNFTYFPNDAVFNSQIASAWADRTADLTAWEPFPEDGWPTVYP